MSGFWKLLPQNLHLNYFLVQQFLKDTWQKKGSRAAGLLIFPTILIIRYRDYFDVEVPKGSVARKSGHRVDQPPAVPP